MKELFFLDVDTQRDFMLPGGGLYVPGAERLAPRLRRIFDFARRNEITVISSADAHAPDDPEFSRFPPHCVAGTDGQKKIPETLFPKPAVLENKPVDRNLLDLLRKNPQIIVQKQQLDLFSNPVLDRLLRVLPQRAIVFGVTTEYCVKLACLELRKRGVKTAVLTDAIRALSPATGQSAMEEMRAAGVDFITTETLFGVHAV